MPLIQLVVVIIVIGVLMWWVNAYVPMADPFKKILMAVVVLVLILWVLQAVGLFDSFSTIRLGPGPRLR